MSDSVKAVRLRSATGVVALGTLISRIFGLARDMVVAALFGAGAATDAFFVAFRIPNTLRRVLAEGGVTVAVQPVYGDRLRESAAAAADYERALLTFVRVLLLPLTALVALGAPWWIPLFAAGFEPGGATYRDAVMLLILVAPFVWFIGMIGAGMGLLNVRGRFWSPAAGPALMNLGLILGALVPAHWWPQGWPATSGLAVGAVVGAAAWAGAQHWELRRSGAALGWLWRPRDPGVMAAGRLLLPALAGLAVYQIQVIVSTQFASFLDAGGVTALVLADRLAQFPLSLTATAIGTVTLPLLTQARLQGGDANRALGEALSWTFFLVLPAVAGLMLLREPLVVLFFVRGQFSVAEASRTAGAVWGYALALVPAAANRILAPALYAAKDMRSPVIAAVFSLFLQSGFSWWWLDYDVTGLAAATAAAAAIQVVVMATALWRRGERPSGWVAPTLRALAATVLMALAVAATLRCVAAQAVWVQTAVAITVGVVVYALAVLALRHPDAARALRLLRRRLS